MSNTTIKEIDARLAKDEAEGRIKLKPISDYLGMEVEGVDLRNELSTEQVATVYDALVRHKVLVFKKIGLNHEQQVRFSYERTLLFGTKKSEKSAPGDAEYGLFGILRPAR